MAIGSVPADKVLGRFMHRLECAGDKLGLAAAHWNTPGEVTDGDLGAVVVVHEVKAELDSLYMDFTDWLMEKKAFEPGPWVKSFDEEDEEADPAAEEAQS